VTETLLSKRYAEAQILKWLHDGLIRWQYERVFGIRGPDRTLKQEAEKLWSHRTVADFEESLARKVTCYHADRRTPLRYINVVGIRVAREDIERQLAQIPRVQLGAVAPQEQLLSEKIEKWLISMQAEFSRLPQKQRSVWVRKVAYPKMKEDLKKDAPWDSWESLRRAMYPHGQK
jgi:hypothetical protein